MKMLSIGAAVLILSVSSFAQDGYQPFALSANPSPTELRRLFAETGQGIHDPFTVLRQVGSMGDSVVPALQTFLFNIPGVKAGPMGPGRKTADTTDAIHPNRVYGIMALEVVGTPLAYRIIMNAAQSDSDSEVRGMALKAIAFDYYYKMLQDSLAPDKSVVRLLLANSQDTTYVRCCASCISDIVHQGLMNWVGDSYYCTVPDSVKVVDDTRVGMRLIQYRGGWWRKNSTRLVWNKKNKHFEVK